MSELAAFQHSLAQTISQPVAGPMAIYRNTVLTGTIDALAANYPVVAAIVGTTMFEAVAVDFAVACPPRSPVLAAYGSGLADWIEEQDWADDLPYLSDVARYERLCTESLFAADAMPLVPHMLADVSPAAWQSLHLNLHPAARFGWSVSPAMSLWLGHQPGSDIGLAPEWQPQGGLFTRPAGAVEAFVLDSAAHRFLFGIRLGEPVGVVAAETANLYPQADIASIFAHFLNVGTFAAVHSNQG